MIQYFLRVIPKGDDFFSNLESTFLSSASNIDIISAWIMLIFEYVVAETICYLNVFPFFSIKCHHGLLMIINIIMIMIIIIIIVITITIKIIIIMISLYNLKADHLIRPRDEFNSS